jgi:anaerobic selenocysteine-containing dehydrogenase
VPDQTSVRTTCPRDCYDACGVLVTIRDGAVHAVRGDPTHHVSAGRLCRKCSIAYNGVLRDPQTRLTTPLRRAGVKGDGRYVAVSWDEALDEIAERLHAVIDRLGPAGILNTHYTGTCGLLGGGFGQRLMGRLGVTEVAPDTICNLAGYAGLGYVYGDTTDGFDPESARDAACIMVWGANPSASAPHQHEHWLGEASARVIVVDPVRTATAVQADWHLQPFPGSDAALAFALMHVMRRDGLVDQQFITTRTIGYDELVPLLEPCTPEWAQGVTGVPAERIEHAAHVYAEGPSMLWLGQGFQRQPRGGNAMRAVAVLPAITGNLGRPGTGWSYVTGTDSRRIDGDYLAATGIHAAAPPAISQMQLADTLADPERAGALIAWNINIAASNPRQAALRRALCRDDLLTVVLDLFMTDSAAVADYVLPAASFLECDDLVCSYFHHTLSAQVRVAPPPGDAMPNSEIFRRLAATLGLTEPQLFESDRAVIDELLSRTGFGVDWDDLAAAGTVRLYPEPRIQPLPGTITIASGQAEHDGFGRVPSPWHDPRPDTDWLRLLTPASPWAMNTSFANDPKIRRKLAEPTVTLHPEDAARRGLVEGAQARLVNGEGELTVVVRIDTITPACVAYAPKGHWGVNVNAVNPGDESDMAASTSVHGVHVRVIGA